MARYRYCHRYRSSYGRGNEGEEVDISDELAAAINVDSPGALERVAIAADVEARVVEAPPNDRMRRGGRRRDQSGDQRRGAMSTVTESGLVRGA